MVQLLRITICALALIAFVAPSASAEVDATLQVYKRTRGATELKLELAEEYPGAPRGGSVCPDSGKGCGFTPNLDQSSFRPLRGSVKRVDGGFLITCEMVTPAYELADGRIVYDNQPWAGMTVVPNQFIVYIQEAGEYTQLKNIVIDYTGSVVDENLNVTRFVAVR